MKSVQRTFNYIYFGNINQPYKRVFIDSIKSVIKYQSVHNTNFMILKLEI